MLYERILPRKATGNALALNLLLIFLYVLGSISSILFLFPMGVPVLFALFALLTLILFLATKKYLKVEYEYSFEGNLFSISKIYSKRARKAIVEIDLKKTLMTAPADEANLERARRLEIDNILDLTASPNAKNVYFTIFEDDAEHRYLVYFEGDEKSLTIIKRIQPTVTTVRPFLS